MSSILIRHDSGDWTPIQNGKVHAGPLGDYDFNLKSHFTYYQSKPIDPKLIGKDCLICGQLTMVNFLVGGAFCANVRTHFGFTSERQTFYSNREWTGGSNFPGSERRTGIFLWQILARPSASNITIQLRVDMGNNTGNIRAWGAGDNQSNMFIFPVHTP
jgi:hypothetical protein